MLKKLFSFLTLFSSLSTLICCALPALFVTLGLGSSLVSLLGAFPQLIWLSERKTLVFGVAGGLLLLTFVMRMVGNQQSCPSDPKLAAQCGYAKKSGTIIFYFSVACYLIGAFFAFLAPFIF